MPVRERTVTVVGKHCESGDVIVRDGQLPVDVTVGDVVATPVTGAYGYSMASTYNKVPAPRSSSSRGGSSRLVVVRRESLDDLTAPRRREATCPRPATLPGHGNERLRVGLLGCGNVGGALAKLLVETGRGSPPAPGSLWNWRPSRSAASRASERCRWTRGLLTTDAARVVVDPDVDVVVEVIGGIEPARTLILSALKSGQAGRDRQQGAARQLR